MIFNLIQMMTATPIYSASYNTTDVDYCDNIVCKVLWFYIMIPLLKLIFIYIFPLELILCLLFIAASATCTIYSRMYDKYAQYRKERNDKLKAIAIDSDDIEIL